MNRAPISLPKEKYAKIDSKIEAMVGTIAIRMLCFARMLQPIHFIVHGADLILFNNIVERFAFSIETVVIAGMLYTSKKKNNVITAFQNISSYVLYVNGCVPS